MLWFTIHILLFLIIVLLLQPIEGLKNKKSKPFKPSKPSKPSKPKPISKAFKKAIVNPVKKVGSAIKKLVTKPKTKTSPIILPVPVEFASYADNVKPPYNGDEFEQNQNDVKEYQKALNGETSNKMVSQNPLGMLYFHNTGTKCLYNGKEVDRHIIVDSRAGTNLYNSADADFNKSMQFVTPGYNKTICVPTTIEPVDVYGRKLPKETRFV